jgi:hypothetical protein
MQRFPDLHSVACGQNHIDQSDVGKLFKFKHPPRLIAETGLTAQRLLQHVSQKKQTKIWATTRSSRWCHTGRI